MPPSLFCIPSLYVVRRPVHTLSLFTQCIARLLMAPPSLKRPASTDRDVSPPPASTRRKVTATTTNKAVANFFTPTSKKSPDEVAPVTFQTFHDTLLVARHPSDAHISSSRPRSVKIAAFDLDDTLIATKSGRTWARVADDWRWWDAVVPGRLRTLHEEGYAIVVVSNQGSVILRQDGKGLGGAMKSLQTFKTKITAVLTALDIPVSLYAGTGQDRFRKPRTGMWEQIVADYEMKENDETLLDREKCFFVGDAAGRAEDKATKVRKDHACSDRDFAVNAGIAFHTPEEFFLNQEVRPFTRTFDPATYVDVAITAQPDATPVVFAKKHDIELVLFCGSPGAGKSTFYWRRLEPLGYERVNQDILKTRQRCMAAATDFINDGRSVAVDNTNADVETRGSWVGLAKKLRIPIRLVHFTATTKLCEHNDTVRALSGDLMNPEARTMLPRIAFHGFATRFREPSVEEGFEDITKVDFTFDGTDDQKRVWKRYWIS